MLKNIFESVLFVIKYILGMGLFFAFFGGLYYITNYISLATGIDFLVSELAVISILLFMGHLFRHKIDELFTYIFITRPQQKKLEIEKKETNKNA